MSGSNDELRDPYALLPPGVDQKARTTRNAPSNEAPSLPPGFGRPGTHQQAVSLMKTSAETGVPINEFTIQDDELRAAAAQVLHTDDGVALMNDAFVTFSRVQAGTVAYGMIPSGCASYLGVLAYCRHYNKPMWSGLKLGGILGSVTFLSGSLYLRNSMKSSMEPFGHVLPSMLLDAVQQARSSHSGSPVSDQSLQPPDVRRSLMLMQEAVMHDDVVRKKLNDRNAELFSSSWKTGTVYGLMTGMYSFGLSFYRFGHIGVQQMRGRLLMRCLMWAMGGYLLGQTSATIRAADLYLTQRKSGLSELNTSTWKPDILSGAEMKQ